MKGGVILFRGSGTDARRYLESDRSRADDYYLEGGTALAEFTAVDARGDVIGELGLTADEYAQWVDWINPFTGESMGKPRLPGEGRRSRGSAGSAAARCPAHAGARGRSSSGVRGPQAERSPRAGRPVAATC